MLKSKAIAPGVLAIVVDAITAIGNDRVHPFSILKKAPVHLISSGTFTVLTGNLEISSDGGVTYKVFLAFDFVAMPIFVFDGVPGVKYRLNVSTLTQSSPPSIKAVA